MTFEKFTRKARVVSDKAMVSVLKGGQLGVNQACNTQYFNGYDYVILYYDKASNIIGIQPTNEMSGDTYRIRRSRDGKVANISALAFLKHYNITHGESRAYVATWNDEYNLVEVHLKVE